MAEGEEEVYVCIQCHRYFDEIYFYHQGGVDVGDVDAKASRLAIKVEQSIKREDVLSQLLTQVPDARKEKMADFLINLYNEVFCKAHFAYLEINPVVLTDTQIVHMVVDCK